MAPLSRPLLGSLGLGLALIAAQPAVLRAQPQAEPQLRVLLLQGMEARLRPAAASAGLRLRDAQGRLLLELGNDRVLQLQRVEAGLELRDASDPGADVLQARELWLEAVPGSSDPDPGIWLGQRRYRGRLQARIQGGQLQLLNHVPLETYLASVVGSEMPASWPIEALRAQAVAARTYALKARKPSAPFDVQATTASQMYKGVEAETPSTRAAVEGTRGLVLTYHDALIDAVFHSSSGGSTESSGNLWQKQLPYLVSVPDFDQASPVSEWRQPLDAGLLRKAFPEVNGARSIEVLSTTSTGRISQVRVIGSGGELLLSGAQLRSRLGLKSTWVRFELASTPVVAAPVALTPAAPATAAAFPVAMDGVPLFAPPPLPQMSQLPQLVAVGRGFGHGIGMSQWGALAMAQRGDSYAAILRHYYRGTQLRPYSELALTALAAGRP